MTFLLGEQEKQKMRKVCTVLYVIFNYLTFIGVFFYFLCFLGNFFSIAPKTIDNGSPGPVNIALVVNLFLLLLFGIQHTLMARSGFKQWWVKIVPKHLERSTYVLLSNLLLSLVMWQWQPMVGVLWELERPFGQNLMWALFFFGFGLVVLSSLNIDHLYLLGLRQAIFYVTGRAYTETPFKIVGCYKFVRHPILLGWMISFWATPRMTMGHFLFAIITTIYMLIAIRYEERDQVALYGDLYCNYREKVPMIIPRIVRRG